MALTFKLAPRTPLSFKIGTKIPARLLGGDGIDIVYANGAYTISTGTFTSTVNITGTATTDRGLNISQSTPATSVVGPHIFNLIDIDSSIAAQHNGSPGFAPPDPLLSRAVRGFETRLNALGGANTSGLHEAGVFQVLHTTANSTNFGIEYIGLVTMAFSDKTSPLGGSGGGLYSINANTFIGSGGSHSAATGVNVECGIFTGGASERRCGVVFQSWGDVHASVTDTAIEVVAGAGEIGWKNFVEFSSTAVSGPQAISSTGDLFRTAQPFTVANVFNLPTVTVTGNIFDFPNFKVTGDGSALTLTSADAGAAPGPVVILHRNSATPAANDIIGLIDITGKDSGGATQNYVRLIGNIIDPTAGSEDGSLVIQAVVNGVVANQAAFGNGVAVGPAAGGYPGIGGLNAVALYEGGVALSALYHPKFTDVLTLTSTDAGAAGGPTLILHRDSASPAANDVIGLIEVTGKDSGGATQNYARIIGAIIDPTAASEDGALAFQTAVAGTLTQQIIFGNGVVVGAATGGYLGTGNLNAVGLYQGGVAVPTISSADTLSNKSIALGSNTVTGTMAQFDTACSDGNFVFQSGAGGTPSSLTLTNATGLPLSTGVTGILPAANGGTGHAGGAWTTYTPTVTASAGTITTSTPTGRYIQIGKTVICQIDVFINDAGTGSGYLRATLPVAAAANNYVGSSYEYNSTGNSGVAVIIGSLSTSFVNARDAANATYIVSSRKVAIGITYEAA